MSTAASQYLREVKKRIPCSGSQKTEFLCQLEAEVIYYCEDHDGVDFAILSENFGSPEEIANDFLSELGGSTVTKAHNVKQRLVLFTAIVVISTTIFVAGLEIISYYKQQQALDGHYVESITYEEDYVEDNVYSALTSDSEHTYY